jgi:hypothetical protein
VAIFVYAGSLKAGTKGIKLIKFLIATFFPNYMHSKTCLERKRKAPSVHSPCIYDLYQNSEIHTTLLLKNNT